MIWYNAKKNKKGKTMSEENKTEEIEKLPKEVIENNNEILVDKVDWFGLDGQLKEEENTEQEETNSIVGGEENQEFLEKKGYSLDIMVSEAIKIFQKKEEQLIKEEETDVEEYKEIGNVKIKNGILYAKEVQDIIDAKIKIEKNNLLVIIPHKKENGVEVELKYLKHNGLWWMCMSKETKLENIEFEQFICKKQMNRITE